MQENEELLEVVDYKGNVIDILPRSSVHGNPSLLHRVVHVLVFNGSGDLLLQKRSMNKDVAPGAWDTSVGGHVNPGEGLLEAVMREAEEELGIRVSAPVFLYSYMHSNPYESELVFTYSCVYEGKVTFNREEIDEVRFWSIGEIEEHLGRKVFSDNFEQEIATYMQASENGGLL
jgi:isopentenyldiphosphate isomerase